jgi:ribonuclease D
MKSFSGRASRSYLDLWWDAVQTANKATELPALRPERTDAIPNHRNWITKFPEADRRLKFAKAALIEISEKNLVPLENLLTPEILRQVSFSPPEPLSQQLLASKLAELGARNWQVEQTSKAIEQAFTLAAKAPALTPETDLPASPEHEEL